MHIQKADFTANADLAAQIAQRESILERVKLMLIRSLRLDIAPEDIAPDTPLFGTGLGLDSVDAVEVVVSLETEFGKKLPDDHSAFSALRTVNTVVDVVIAQLGDQP